MYYKLRNKGGQELQKIWEERSESEISPISCPKLGEEQKKKVRFFAPILVRFFLPKFGPIFCLKLGEEQKKKVFTQIWSDFWPEIRWSANEGLHSQIWSDFLARNLVKSKKKKVFTQIWSDFLPKLECRPKTNGQNIAFV